MDDFGNLSRQDLVLKVRELQALLDAIESEKNDQEFLNFPWIGNLGNWYWYRKTNRVIFNEAKIIALGYQKDEIPNQVGFEFFTQKLHPDDYDLVMENMRRHLGGLSPAYEITYRIRRKDGEWIWFYDRGKITKQDEDGKPELVAGIVFDVTEQKKMEELLKKQNQQLLELSLTDPLTGLFNRRALFDKLDYELKRAARIKNYLCLLMLDIDYFKKINDTYGHLIGDEILKGIAEALRNNVRDTDIVGRYGGEEFLIVLPDCALSDGINVAEKIRHTIMGSEFVQNIKITISGGIVEYGNENIEDFINSADLYLYQAKQKGRNRIEYP